MNLREGSIRFKVLIPVFALVMVISLFLFLLILDTAHTVSRRHFGFVMEQYSSEAKNILDTAITEMISARLLENPVVVEAKQRIAAEEIARYWKEHDLTGIILSENGRVVYSSLDAPDQETIGPFLSREGVFHRELGFSHSNGYVITFPAWGWRVATVHRPVLWISEVFSREVQFLLGFVLLGMVVLFLSIQLVFRRNFQGPVRSILTDLDRGDEVRKTGITELDTIVSAINESFLRLRHTTEHVRTLHDIALSLHDQSRDDTINAILERVGANLGAAYSALLLLDDTGDIRDLFTQSSTGKPSPGRQDIKGILEYARHCQAPERIAAVADHPAIRGSYPDSLPPLENLIIVPVFSDDRRHLGALLFAGKQGGFSEEDEDLLRAVAADTAVSLSKAENLMLLMRFKQVIDSAFDVIAIAGGDRAISYVNPACEKVTGHAAAELERQQLDILFGIRQGASGDVWNTLSAGRVWKGEFLNRKRGGESYYASAVVFSLPMAGEQGYAMIARDITQEKLLYEQLLRAQKLEAIGTLAGGIAHDFNNLLAAILGYAEMMQLNLREGDPLFKPVSIIHKAAMQGAELTKKILSLTRREVPEVKPVDINEVIMTALDLLQRSMPKSIEVMPQLSANLPPVLADPSQIQQIIVNLALNARDAMPGGGRLVITTTYLPNSALPQTEQSPDSGGAVRLSISDTGTGMDEDTIRKIFDPFFTTKETGKGTGLGLYIVHAIVTSYGGQIAVNSEPGKGTRFTLSFPVTTVRESGLEEHQEDLRGNGTILVIDDEPHVRELCRDILQPLGYRVLAAGGGSEGIQIFREMKDRIPLVILDMIMPKMGGGEVFEILRTMQPEVKIILCSGYNREGLTGIQSLTGQGAATFIEKPFRRVTLARAVKEALSAGESRLPA